MAKTFKETLDTPYDPQPQGVHRTAKPADSNLAQAMLTRYGRARIAKSGDDVAEKSATQIRRAGVRPLATRALAAAGATLAFVGAAPTVAAKLDHAPSIELQRANEAKVQAEAKAREGMSPAELARALEEADMVQSSHSEVHVDQQ